MRGKVVINCLCVICLRITPAYAGKRLLIACMAFWRKDHPRVCGEKSFLDFIFRHGEGSPPRMRGKVLAISALPSAIQDHPRVCGEKQYKTNRSLLRIGSPPRMRGKVNRNNERHFNQRITPAYAGKRLKQTGLSMQE